MNKKRYILYGVGRQGKLALQKYGRERVAYFCDTYSELEQIDNIPVIRPEILPEIMKKEEFTVVITPKIEKVREDITAKLDEMKIEYLIFEKTDGNAYGTKTFYIRGKGEAPEYIIDEEETRGYNWRVKPTVSFFRAVFQKYEKDFFGKKLDISVYVGDHVLDAYHQLLSEGIDHIFAYSTIYAYSDRVIPIPDYRVCFDKGNYDFPESPQECRRAGERRWKDARIAWRGTIASSDERKWLEMISKRFPDKLYVDDPSWEQNQVYIPMTDLAKYKYLLDIRGYGWTDRVKILMQLSRPLFLVERPYTEWYFDDLLPMEHYIPVREDLSDLLEKYEYMEKHPEEYNRIVDKMQKFSDEHFSADSVMQYLRNVVLKYGVVQK